MKLVSRHRREIRTAIVAIACISAFFSRFIVPEVGDDASQNMKVMISTPHKNVNQTSSLDRTNNINVTLTMRRHRKDRMGSRLQLPLTAWALARHHNWNFCAPHDDMVHALSFPICPSGFLKSTDAMPQFEFTTVQAITESGIYFVNPTNNPILRIMNEHEHNSSKTSLWSDSTVNEWRRMILESPLNNGMDSYLWSNPKAIHIAVNVRRGDIEPMKRNDVWTGDEQVIALIEMAKHYVHIVRGSVDVEVHLFSESYGTTNWTRYGDLVDYFHLAPKGSNDINLNIRDWKHFVQADVLIVGGTFSLIPAYSRLDLADRGLPITVYQLRGMDPTFRNWVPWKYGRDRQEITVKFPSVDMIASTVVKDNGDPLFGLCDECLAASVPGAFWCSERIKRHMANSSMKLRDAQFIVSGEYEKCSACHPNQCGLANHTIIIGNGWQFSVRE